MRVLVVDDSMTIRAMLRRALLELPPVEVAEAANGMEALAEIARHRFDLVILDVTMPVMDGIETLAAIRSSPAYAAMPVVVLTSVKGDTVVHRLVEMGITDYLSKPLSPDQLTTRLTRIMSRLRKPAAPIRKAAGTSHGRRLVIVEQDPDRRHYLVNVLSTHYQAVEADSGAMALQVCLDESTPPVDVVLVGEQTGLPPLPMFLAKLRTLERARDARVIGYRYQAGGEAGRTRALVDDMVEWSYVPEVFLAGLQRAVSGTGASLIGMPAFRASLERDIVAATEQLFGLMLSSEVVLVEPGSAGFQPWPGRGVHATIDLVADEHVFTLVFRTTDDSARVITAQLVGATPDDVHQADQLATAAEFANIVAGRVRNRLVEAGLATKLQLPRTWVGGTAEGFEARDASDLTFLSAKPKAHFGLLLGVRGPAAAPEA